MKGIRKKNLRNIVTGQLNINSLRNKLDLLVEQIKEIINGYMPPLDRDQHGGGIMVFIGEDITAKFLSSDTKPIEGLYIESNFCKRKWLLSCSHMT